MYKCAKVAALKKLLLICNITFYMRSHVRLLAGQSVVISFPVGIHRYGRLTLLPVITWATLASRKGLLKPFKPILNMTI